MNIKAVIAVETVYFTALFLTCEDKADIFVLMLLKEKHQLEEFHFMGNALDGADVKHIGKTGIPDGENLFFYLIFHR